MSCYIDSKTRWWLLGGFFLIAIIVAVITSLLVQKSEHYTLSIIHFNDFHARYDEITTSSSTCKPGMTDCVGGFSRVYAAVQDLMSTLENPIFLNAGDTFQGTVWYTLYKWNVTQYFMNFLPMDAITLGNHEFDDGIPGVIPYMKALKAPIVLANVDDSNEPDFQGLYKKSTTIIRNNKKIGIIGVLTATTLFISNPGKLNFTDEVEAVRKEADRLKHDENCDIIIVLSHCGSDTDRKIAANGGPFIDFIVGGHSHTLYYTGDDVPGPDKPAYNYPDIITQSTGRQVYIVQSSCFSKYIGHITLTFSSKNEIIDWNGNSVYLGHDVPQDEKMNELLAPWKESVDALSNQEIANTTTVLDHTTCSSGECNLGDLITDAYITAWPLNTSGSWAYTPIALTNAGGIRTNLDVGVITVGDLVGVIPFENTLDAFELQGQYLLEALEHAAATDDDATGKFYSQYLLQVSGLKFTINASQPNGHRIENVQVRCGECKIPSYGPLDLAKMYRIVGPSYLLTGGDGFTAISNNYQNRQFGPLDVEVTEKFMEQNSPLNYTVSDRITVVS